MEKKRQSTSETSALQKGSMGQDNPNRDNGQGITEESANARGLLRGKDTPANPARPALCDAPSNDNSPESLAGMLDEAKCRDVILRRLHPRKGACPSCGAPLDETTARNFWQGRRCVCKACNRWFTALSGTSLHGTQLSFSQIFLLGTFENYFTNGITPADVAKAVGVSTDTVRVWQRRFRS